MKFASLCLLSYERATFLAEAIRTIHACAEFPFELIVHDDGSKDPAVHAVLDKGIANGTISTVIRNAPGHNEGQGIALNRMFAAARGDYLVKLDQDLIFKPGWLRIAVAIIEENRRYSGDYAQEAGDRPPRQDRIGLLGFFHYHQDPVMSMKCKLRQFKGWQSHTHICGSGFLMPRESWKKLGPFEERSDAFAEDYLMQRKVTDSAEYVCGLPDNDLVYNQGFGIGPSTLVLGEDEGGGHVIQSIHHPPTIFGVESQHA